MREHFTGYVKVKDGNKGPLDYSPNREVEVSISFSTDVRSDLKAITQEAAQVADDVVNEKLGRSTEQPKARATRAKADKPPTAPTAAAPAPTVATEAKVATADPAAIGETAPAQSGQLISTGGDRNDPAAMGLDDLMKPVAPAPITDSHLMAAITRTNAKFENKQAPAIRALILQYVPKDGKHHQAHEIEQDKRQAFLLELDKIGQ